MRLIFSCFKAGAWFLIWRAKEPALFPVWLVGFVPLSEDASRISLKADCMAGNCTGLWNTLANCHPEQFDQGPANQSISVKRFTRDSFSAFVTCFTLSAHRLHRPTSTGGQNATPALPGERVLGMALTVGLQRGAMRPCACETIVSSRHWVAPELRYSFSLRDTSNPVLVAAQLPVLA